jgi:hypothetical protein
MQRDCGARSKSGEFETGKEAWTEHALDLLSLDETSAEVLNPVRDLRSFVPLVGELCHRQGEWLQISGDWQWSSVDGVETDI